MASHNLSRIQTSGKTFIGKAVERLAMMCRAESEDCSPVSTTLHQFYNPLPINYRSAQLKNDKCQESSLSARHSVRAELEAVRHHDLHDLQPSLQDHRLNPAIPSRGK